MAKAKEAKEAKGYDASAEQSIPLNLAQNGRKITVRHHLAPLSDERYFKLQEDIETDSERLKKLSTEIYRAKDSLWTDLVQSITGYGPLDSSPDFKTRVPLSHRVEAVNALVEVQFTDPEPIGDGDYFDIDALITVPFSAMSAGALYTDLSLTFRPESKAEMDEFLGVQNNQPDSNRIASAEKRSKMEKLYDLGKKLLRDRAGYADGSEVPPWHLAPATEIFFVRQIAQAGKALA